MPSLIICNDGAVKGHRRWQYCRIPCMRQACSKRQQPDRGWVLRHCNGDREFPATLSSSPFSHEQTQLPYRFDRLQRQRPRPMGVRTLMISDAM
ncbi:hypothetical protein RHECNPAF_13300106 [Rhizobium etli CNPAF512]|nr:hypothetical protein RHECNPAF_13300106 [Rhizobium etli CNPAF512]